MGGGRQYDSRSHRNLYCVHCYKGHRLHHCRWGEYGLGLWLEGGLLGHTDGAVQLSVAMCDKEVGKPQNVVFFLPGCCWLLKLWAQLPLPEVQNCRYWLYFSLSSTSSMYPNPPTFRYTDVWHYLASVLLIIDWSGETKTASHSIMFLANITPSSD